MKAIDKPEREIKHENRKNLTKKRERGDKIRYIGQVYPNCTKKMKSMISIPSLEHSLSGLYSPLSMD